jgi:hypothetical protein
MTEGELVKKIIGVIAFLAAMSLSAMAQTQQPIRVNCGGPSYTDSKGQVWQADSGYNVGTASSVPTNITGMADSTLYWSNRYNSNAAKPLIYTFSIANGNYHVNLYFAEIVTSLQTKGARVFNVKIQGNSIFQNLDIFAQAGANTALVKGAEVAVSNGAIAIEFDNVVQNAKINAIEILPAAAPTLALNFKYPDGSPVSGNLTYTITSSLLTLQGATPLINGQATAALFANPSTMGLSTQFQIKLNLMDTAGHVLWEITLGMNPSEVNLGAVQSSSLNVVVQKM